MKRDEDGHLMMTNREKYSKNIQFKRNPMADWEVWMYMPPSEKTVKILKKEVANTVEEMKKEGEFRVARVCSVFFGHPVYAFKMLDGTEIYLDK